jgi:hypothetical protein
MNDTIKTHTGGVTLPGAIMAIGLGAIVMTGAIGYAKREKAAAWPSEVRVDKETGCEYIISGLSGAATPRFGRDGKPICG